MPYFYKSCPLTEKRVKATPWTNNLCNELHYLTVQINYQKDTTEEYSVAMAGYGTCGLQLDVQPFVWCVVWHLADFENLCFELLWCNFDLSV